MTCLHFSNKALDGLKAVEGREVGGCNVHHAAAEAGALATRLRCDTANGCLFLMRFVIYANFFETMQVFSSLDRAYLALGYVHRVRTVPLSASGQHQNVS